MKIYVTHEVPEEVMEEWARRCQCCPHCWECPCGGCCQGSVCDAMPCTCDDDYSDDCEADL